MPAWQASAGATLLIPSGAGKHLFVALNDPVVLEGYGTQGCVVLVNVSTVRGGIPFDDTCVVEAGSHSFVTARSYMRYQDARIYRAIELSRLVAQGLFSPHEPVSADLLSQMKAGLRASPRTKREFKTLKI
jgi:hypothetical protein